MKSNMIKFKYHPEPVKTGVFITGEKVQCECCGEDVDIYYNGPFYAEEELECICLECISSGRTAQKFDGEFIDRECIEEIEDKSKLEELIYRTPSYNSIQEEHWLAHCEDYCAFIGDITWSEIEEMDIVEEIIEDIQSNFKFDIDEIKDGMKKDGQIKGYLFKCLHCGKHRIYIDFD